MEEDKKYTLRDVRREMGLTVEQFATVLGMDFYYYRNRERGDVECRASDCLTIITYSGLDFTDIDWKHKTKIGGN